MSTAEERMQDAIEELEQETRLLRARNDRLQAEAKAVSVQECNPIDCQYIDGLGKTDCDWCRPKKLTTPLVQEPVQDEAWKAEQKALADAAIKCATEAIADVNGPIKAVREYYGATPPAAQRPWVGLTDSEKADLWKRDTAIPFSYADAIEVKLKAKNSP